MIFFSHCEGTQFLNQLNNFKFSFKYAWNFSGIKRQIVKRNYDFYLGMLVRIPISDFIRSCFVLHSLSKKLDFCLNVYYTYQTLVYFIPKHFILLSVMFPLLMKSLPFILFSLQSILDLAMLCSSLYTKLQY